MNQQRLTTMSILEMFAQGGLSTNAAHSSSSKTVTQCSLTHTMPYEASAHATLAAYLYLPHRWARTEIRYGL
jgi:hypothetical protein